MSDQRIWIGCLASYNAGTLYGEWVDLNAPLSENEIQAEIDRILRESPEPEAEEWAIMDYEGFGDFDLGENPDLEDLATLVNGIDKHGEIFADYCEHIGKVDADAFDEAYQGECRDLGEWAEELAESAGWINKVPGHLRPYIDFDSMGRDAELSGDIFTIERGGTVYVFWND